MSWPGESDFRDGANDRGAWFKARTGPGLRVFASTARGMIGALQTRLNTLGGRVSVDGIWGQGTTDALLVALENEILPTAYRSALLAESLAQRVGPASLLAGCWVVAGLGLPKESIEVPSGAVLPRWGGVPPGETSDALEVFDPADPTTGNLVRLGTGDTTGGRTGQTTQLRLPVRRDGGGTGGGGTSGGGTGGGGTSGGGTSGGGTSGGGTSGTSPDRTWWYVAGAAALGLGYVAMTSKGGRP